MPVSDVVDAFADLLARTVTPAPALVGGAAPLETEELPALTLSVSDVVSVGEGLGRRPGPTVSGALRIDVTIDLADPVLRIGQDAVPLLSGDRLVFQLPHGSVVKADGSVDTAFTASDLAVTADATTFSPVSGTPSAGQVGLDPVTGTLTFPDPLPPSGPLLLGYFVGLWDLEAEHLRGALDIEVAAVDAQGVDAMSRSVEAALARTAGRAVPGLNDLRPVALGRIDPSAEALGAGRRRVLRYRFDVELQHPLPRTSGGSIRDIDVAIEPFDERLTIREETRT